ncbi:NADH-ubiquinone oxidoreductase-F iron-sulfur binding region domain-containing protein [Nocardia huaxiensis]|nr:NADH-ubiquinone oxidoreductase-F iron-sulfur binding region domain-containing protein [Nocardia huaxiensis]
MIGQPRDWMALRANRFAASAANATEGLREAIDDHHEIRRSDIAEVAKSASLPTAAVAGSASFYADLADPQRIRVCEGTGCFVARGGAAATTGDHGHVYCLGLCYTGPAAMIDGVPVTEQGPPGPIPFACAAPEPVVLAGLSGVDEPWDTWSAVLAAGAWSGVIGEVVRSGLRGRGGAEFPAGAKWRAALLNPGPRWVVANGDEGDPGSYCDRLLMEYDPHRVLEGMALCGAAVGARHGRVLVRSEYPAALAAMRAAVEEAGAAGHLGTNVHGSGLDFEVVVQEGAGSYVAGEETALLRSLQGLRGAVQARPPYPTDCGFAGRPTVVQNVETLAAIPWIVRHSGESYARLGLPLETGTKLVCLNAEFARPGVYEVEFGTSLRHIVEELGGGLRDGHALRAVQIGGPLGGYLGADELDIGLATKDLAAYGVALGHGSLIAIPEHVPAAALLRNLWTFARRESCGACAPCRVGTQRGFELAQRSAPDALTQPAYGRLLDIMATGSLCAYGSGVAAAVRSLLRVYGASAPERKS